MKKILSINGTSFYSTGTIIKNIEFSLRRYYRFYHATADGISDSSYLITGKRMIREFGKIPTQLFGNDGFAYNHETKKMIKWIDKIKPDLIHIHNVHGYFMNVELLLDYIFQNNIPVVYTMHDCWTFTGRCAYFDSVGCNKWKTGCGNCKYKGLYPKSRFFDFSKRQWLVKKRLFSGHNITFVAPSEWLKKYTEDSFLKNENVLVVNNGIQTDIFSKKAKDYCTPKNVDPNKKIILSVAYPFTPQKGLEDLNKLQKIIDKNEYQIIAIGVTNEFKTIDGIVRIPPTKDKEYLAFWYQHSYVFVSFTYQDNYPTVLLESIASGTPAIAYKVGGCPEIVSDGKTGYCVPLGDVDLAYEKIKQARGLDRNVCKAVGAVHSISSFVDNYHSIYKKILGE